VALVAERLVVVGGGTMGVGIAIVAARAGYGVDIVEPSSASRERATAYVQREAERTGDSAFVARIRWSEAIGNTGASIAIEAVPEIYELKRDVFVSLARALSSEAILATNTSSLAVADLADSVAHPERVLGLHFFNPAVRMQLVEVVQAPQTGDAYLERALEFVARCGKQAVLAADTPGFIVNRVARPYYLQALRSLELGVATAEELDALARAVGFRMGPFELMDFIGLDVNLATSESVYARIGEERFAPSQLQREMVEKGLLGRKAGRGFYDYREASAPRFEAVPAVTDDTPNSDERVVVVGFGDLAHQFYEALRARYVNVELLENDEFLENLSPDATMVVDTGPGAEDRGEAVARLDAMFGKDTIFFVDAYATDLRAAAKELRYPERVVGYGLLGSLDSQSAVEIVDSDQTADDALELAQEVFATVGKGVVLVEDTPGLFLGRTVGSIVNEAMIAVAEEVADSEDVDIAMRLGANYPVGPTAWGRQIGGVRLTRILKRLADAEGERFAPHRSLWLLDVEEPATQAEIAE
jgi:3-hydroxybutyryl-CoA dehydrogenase